MEWLKKKMDYCRPGPGAAVGLYYLASMMFMHFVSTFGYERTPKSPPLPDVVFELLPAAESSFYPTDIVTTSLLFLVIFLSIKQGRSSLVCLRGLMFTYALLLNMRTLTISVTNLPVPNTTGPCRDEFPDVHVLGRLKTTLIYTFALGFRVPGVFQCGDLIFSGHTTYIWLMTLHCIRVWRKVYPNELLYHPKWLLVAWCSFGTLCIVMWRQHYSVDVILGFFLTFFVWHALQYKVELLWMKKSSRTVLDEILLWVFGSGNYLQPALPQIVDLQAAPKASPLHCTELTALGPILEVDSGVC